MVRGLRVVVAAWLVACGGDDDGAVDGGGDPADAGGEACGELAALAPSWLDGLADDAVARLSGAVPIRTGVTLPDRATAGRRAEARAFLVDQLASYGLPVMLDDYGTGQNVYAEIAPTEGVAASWLVLGAHYDSVTGSPGANDNASGTAVVLVAARYLAELDCRTRGVIVALFDEEETGLVGSQNFAALLDDSGLAIDSVHTVDQMGWDADGDRAIELELPGAGLQARYQAAKDLNQLDLYLTPTTTPSSDHQAFRAGGYLAVGLTEEYISGDTTPYYHLPQDTHATVDLGYLASTAQLVNAVVGGFATGQGQAAASASGSALERLAGARAARLPRGPRPTWLRRRP